MPAYNYPIPTIVNIGYLSAVFGDQDRNKNNMFRGGTKSPDNRYPFLMHMEAALLDWYNTNFPNNTDLPNVGNYVLGLAANYLGAALAALGNAGGIVINPTTGNPINLAFYRADFTIGDAGSLMDAGDTTCTIPLSGFLKDSVEMYPSGTNLTIGDAQQFSINSVTYTASYVIINLNQAVQDGERYIITGLRATAGTVAGGGGSSSPSIPLPLQQGKFLTNDGTDLKWDDVWIQITAADFEADGVTYIDETLNGYYLKVVWENLPKELDFEAGEATLIDGGGFIVNITDFDATQNPDWRFTIYKKSLD